MAFLSLSAAEGRGRFLRNFMSINKTLKAVVVVRTGKAMGFESKELCRVLAVRHTCQ
jgi:hypothetical protein